MKYFLYSFLILTFLTSCSSNGQTNKKKQTKAKKEIAVIKTNMGTIELELRKQLRILQSLPTKVIMMVLLFIVSLIIL
jgi:hypothetical protein